MSKPKFLMPYGKYKGKQFKEILELDPSYILWLVENTDIDVPSEIVNEANELTSNSGPWEDLDGDPWGDLDNGIEITDML